jgi:dihydrodipicolinate synthase/N-acetylneuraminate lyase
MFSDELKNKLKNVHAYATTPFRADNILQLDLDGLTRNLEFLIDNGVQVINVGGGTGEIETLSAAELMQITEQALKVAANRALITPSLPGNLAMAAELAPQYERLGTQVALAMAPFIRNQVPDDLAGVPQYYRILAEQSGLALLPYNTQGWSAELFAQLADIDKIIGVKDPCQEPHNLFRAIKLLGDKLVWVGNKRHDPGVLHFRYQMGIEGFTAGFINFLPRYELELHQAALRQDWDRMIVLQDQLAPLENLRAHYGDAVIKAGMDLVGLAGGAVRPPRTNLSREGQDALRDALAALGE